MISENGPKPKKSSCFESNLGVALNALKNYAFNSNKIKLVYYFILCLVYKLMVKHLKLDLTKINYDFFKTPHKEPSQNSRKHAVG